MALRQRRLIPKAALWPFRLLVEIDQLLAAAAGHQQLAQRLTPQRSKPRS